MQTMDTTTQLQVIVKNQNTVIEVCIMYFEATDLMKEQCKSSTKTLTTNNAGGI